MPTFEAAAAMFAQMGMPPGGPAGAPMMHPMLMIQYMVCQAHGGLRGGRSGDTLTVPSNDAGWSFTANDGGDGQFWRRAHAHDGAKSID